MATPSRIQRVYERIWAIWAADTGSLDSWSALVKFPNRIRFDQKNTVPTRLAIDQGKPGDFPAVMLEVDDFTAEVESAGLTLGDERNGSCSRETKMQVTFTATAASEILKVGQIDLIPVRMANLILAQPRDLGMSTDDQPSFVDGVGRIIGKSVKTKKGMAAGTFRRVTTIKIPVNIYFSSSDL